MKNLELNDQVFINISFAFKQFKIIQEIKKILYIV